jgi:general secretion pathway protein I
MMNRQAGFTLLEIMIALAIFALVSATLIRNAAQSANQTGIIQQRTIAYWIAENQINELRLLPRNEDNFPGIGSDREKVTMAGQDWEVLVDVEATENQEMRRIIVSVFSPQDLDNDIVELIGFIGKH